MWGTGNWFKVVMACAAIAAVDVNVSESQAADPGKPVVGKQVRFLKGDSAYTEYHFERCPHRVGRDVEDYGEWRCNGLNSITVLITAGDPRTTMSFGPRAGTEPASAQTLRGFNSIERGRIEWRRARERARRSYPFVAIVRWTTSLVDERGSAEQAVRGKVLVVTRLGPGGACHIGYVDALANANANEIARKVADERAASFCCDVDKPIIVGATGPGFSRSGEAITDDLP
jgi:hypothetical protein